MVIRVITELPSNWYTLFSVSVPCDLFISVLCVSMYMVCGTVVLFLEDVVALKRAVWFGCDWHTDYARSPRIRRASWMSFGMIVTRFAWIAHKLVSSKRPTK